MSIASEIQNYADGLSDAYNAVNDMSGVIPQDKNMNNLDSAIRTIPVGSTPNDGKLTITMNGTNVGEFTANQSTDTTIALTDTTYTAGNGINIANNEVSVDTSVVATQTDLGNYVTLNTDQNITGEKTFVGNKRIKFKGTASNSKLGFTAFDQNNGETGYLEVEGSSTGSKKIRLGCYDQNSGGSTRDNYVGFQYHNTRASGGTVSYNLVCPPQYRGISGTNAFAYIPVDFTDGNTTVRADNTGVLNLSTLLPSYSNFTGATSSVAGTNGLVPAPAAGDEGKVLTGDGSWTNIFNLIYPVGSIYMSVNNTDPGTLFGGTWAAWGAGRVPVGVDTNDTDFDTVEETGGEKTHTLNVAEMPSHSHGYLDYWSVQAGSGSYKAVSYDTNDGGSGIGTATVGGNGAHNNLQPYITCYMWKRTA